MRGRLLFGYLLIFCFWYCTGLDKAVKNIIKKSKFYVRIQIETEPKAAETCFKTGSNHLKEMSKTKKLHKWLPLEQRHN